MKNNIYLKSFLLSVVCSFGHLVASYAQVYEWATSTGSTLSDISGNLAVDGLGNVYSISFQPIPDGAKTYISKQNANGVFIWRKSVGETNSYVNGYGITVDVLGNIYITGGFTGITSFGGILISPFGNLTNRDIFVSKLNENGDFIWAKNMGELGSSNDIGFDIAVDSLGNVYTIGNFSGQADFDPNNGTQYVSSAGRNDVFVSKLDKDGNFVWAKGMGGKENDIGKSITLDKSGHIYITGNFSGQADFDPSNEIMNLNSTGQSDIFISKLDTDGNFIWAKQIGGTDRDLGNSITVDNLGNVYTTGEFRGVVDFDPGNGTSELSSNSDYGTFTNKLDANGNFIWAKNIAAGSSSFGNGIAVDPYNNIYTTGSFSRVADFDPGVGEVEFTSFSATDDIFISKLDTDGNFVWAKRLGGDSPDKGYSIVVDQFENIYISGQYQKTADFDPNIGVANLSSVGDNDVFVCKLSKGDITTSFFEDKLKNPLFIPSLTLIDNPQPLIKGETTNIQNIAIKIYNSTGQLVFENSDKIQLTQSIWMDKDFKSGVYFWTVEGNFINGTPLNIQGKVKGKLVIL